jgi:penicillin-binding protein 2
LIPSKEWKQAATGTAWSQGETLIAGIGQGAVLATPLQLAVMVARLVTGRVVVPRLVRSEGVLPPSGDRASPDFPVLGVDPRVLALVLDGMSAVVNEQGGTAYAQRITDPGFTMGGKSGTSQVRAISQYEHEHGLRKINQIPWKERDHALFVAYAPVDAPRYVCATIVEHGGIRGGHGSEVAGPICRDILLEAQRRDPARRVPSANTLAELPALNWAAPPFSNRPGG